MAHHSSTLTQLITSSSYEKMASAHVQHAKHGEILHLILQLPFESKVVAKKGQNEVCQPLLSHPHQICLQRMLSLIIKRH